MFVSEENEREISTGSVYVLHLLFWVVESANEKQSGLVIENDCPDVYEVVSVSGYSFCPALGPYEQEVTGSGNSFVLWQLYEEEASESENMMVNENLGESCPVSKVENESEK